MSTPETTHSLSELLSKAHIFPPIDNPYRELVDLDYLDGPPSEHTYEVDVAKLAADESVTVQGYGTTIFRRVITDNPFTYQSRTIETSGNTIIGVPLVRFNYHNPEQSHRDAIMHIIDIRMNPTVKLGLVNALGRTGITNRMYGPEPMTRWPRFYNESHEAADYLLLVGDASDPSDPRIMGMINTEGKRGFLFGQTFGDDSWVGFSPDGDPMFHTHGRSSITIRPITNNVPYAPEDYWKMGVKDLPSIHLR